MSFARLRFPTLLKIFQIVFLLFSIITYYIAINYFSRLGITRSFIWSLYMMQLPPVHHSNRVSLDSRSRRTGTVFSV